MAITTTASILLELDGVQARMHLPAASSLDALRTFATALADYTTATIVEISFTQAETLSIAGVAGETQALDFAAMLLFHGETRKTKSKKFVLPAPSVTMFENDATDHLRVKRAKGAALAQAYADLTGETFAFVKGRVYQYGD